MRIPTVSDPDPARVDTARFDEFLAELEAQFPLLHERLELTRIPTHALLFRWAGRAAERPVVLMAHLDVVPVDDGALAAPAVRRDHRRRRDLGPRHPRRQGQPGRDLRGRRDAPRAGLHPGAGRVAVVRLRRGGVRHRRAARRRRAGTPRRAAVVRPRRGRGDRPRGVPRRGRPDRRHRGHREGHHLARAARRGRGGHASTPARMGPTARLARAILRLERSPLPAHTPSRPSSCSGGSPRTRRSRCARCSRTPAGCAPSSPAPCSPPAPRPRR